MAKKKNRSTTGLGSMVELGGSHNTMTARLQVALLDIHMYYLCLL